MNTQDIQAIILAGGRSSRFQTGKSKLLEKICGQEMILYSTKLMESLKIPMTVLLGHARDQIQETITKHHHTIQCAIQEEQRGTGHALLCTQQTWFADTLLIMNGDMPLLSADIVKKLIEEHRAADATISLVIAHNTDSCGSYGRVVQEHGTIRIVEAAELKTDAYEACCINAGIYLMKRSFVEKHIQHLSLHDTKEFYITDLIELAAQKNLRVHTVLAPFDIVRGVNTLKELWSVEHIKRSELVSYWMSQGVRFAAAHNVQLDVAVTIGAGTCIGNGVHILNKSTIGNNCIIESFSIVSDSVIADNTIIYSHSLIYDSHIQNNCTIGPFARIEAQVNIGENSVIGNFVQVKKSTIGAGTKAKHLTFIGNSIIGNNVNIGAGTITCNYDGKQKHTTAIEDNCFIGSNNTLIAPVTLGNNSFTAAGSVITKDVPAGALAIARERQINKEHYIAQLHPSQTQEEEPILAATSACL